MKELGVGLRTKFKTDGGDIYSNVTQPMRMLVDLSIELKRIYSEIQSLEECITQGSYRKVIFYLILIILSQEFTIITCLIGSL